MPFDTLTGFTSDSSVDRLLDRIGIPYEPALAVVDSGCALGGDGKPVPTLRALLGNDSAFQKLNIDDHESFDPSHHYLFTVDIDGDGALELLVRKFLGGTGNTQYYVWRYDAAKHRMTTDSTMTAMPNLRRWPGRRCIAEGWHGGGAERATIMKCLRDGRWTEVWSLSGFVQQGN